MPVKGSTLAPVAFKNWNRKIGFGNRLELQILQWGAKYPLKGLAAVMPGNNPRLSGIINNIDTRMDFLQEDYQQYSEAFRQAMVERKWYMNKLIAGGTLVAPLIYRVAEPLIDGTFLNLTPGNVLASGIWVITALALGHLGKNYSVRKMVSEHKARHKLDLEENKKTIMDDSVPATLAKLNDSVSHNLRNLTAKTAMVLDSQRRLTTRAQAILRISELVPEKMSGHMKENLLELLKKQKEIEEAFGQIDAMTRKKQEEFQAVAEEDNKRGIMVTPEQAKALPVLLVDDMPQVLQPIKNRLERIGFPVKAVSNCEKALAEVGQNPGKYRMFIIDQYLENNRKGHELVTEMAEKLDPKTSRIIIYSADPTPESRAHPINQALAKGIIHRYVEKSTNVNLFDHEITREASNIVTSHVSSAVRKKKYVNNAISLFMEKIRHQIVNFAFAYTSTLEQHLEEPTNESLLDVAKTAGRLVKRITRLEEFAKNISDISVRSVNQTELGDIFEQNLEEVSDLWDNYDPAKRYKFRLIVKMYLDHGLREVKEKINSAKIDRETLDQIVKILENLRLSSQLRFDGDMTDLFSHYYEILDEMDG